MDGTRICAFHARIIRCSRTAAYRVASRLSEPRVRAEQARRVTPPEADHFNPSSHLFPQHRPSDRNRKKVEYPPLKPEEVPPLMTVLEK